MMPSRWWVRGAAATALLLGLRSDAFACDCPAPPPVADAYAKATFVVVVQIDPDSKAVRPAIQNGPRAVTAILPVLRSYKGAFEKSAVAVDVDYGSRCGYLPAPPGEHLLYLEGPEAHLTASGCGRSIGKRSDGYAAERKALDTLIGINAAPPPSTPTPTPPTPNPNATPTPNANPTSNPSAAPARGGCAGCAIHETPAGDGAWLVGLLAGAIGMRRRASRRA